MSTFDSEIYFFNNFADIGLYNRLGTGSWVTLCLFYT